MATNPPPGPTSAPRTGVPALLLASQALALCYATGWAADPLTPEPREAYGLARDRIPGFPAGDRSAEPANLVDLAPASWQVVGLDGTWQVRACPEETMLDYLALDAGYGPLAIPPLLRPAPVADPAWRDQRVPWSEAFRPGPDGKPQDFRGVVYYRRSLDLPAYDPATQYPALVFTGAGHRTDAWLGEHYLGSHIGGWNRFAFDLRQAAKPGTTLPLLVKCLDTRAGTLWNDRLNVGIYAPVRLEIRPLRALDDLRCRITPDGAALEARFELPPAQQQGAARLEAVLTEAASGRVVAQTTAEADLRAPGFVRVALAQPRWWSPEDPFLYRLTLRLDGVEVGTRRLGWRTIAIAPQADGKQRFLLNGVPIWLRAFEFDSVLSQVFEGDASGTEFGLNYRGHLRDLLLVMKFANVNTFRPHAMAHFHEETFFNLCDELGFLVYLDWNGGARRYIPGTGIMHQGGSPQASALDAKNRDADALGETLRALHDHPSLAFISFGNEMYDHNLPTGQSWDATLDRLSRIARAADWQARPLSGSSGRETWQHQAAVDFVDHHQYIGAFYGTSQDLVPYLAKTTQSIRRRFGAALPFVNMETGYVFDNRIHRVNDEGFGQEARAAVPDKAKVIAYLRQDKSAEAGWLRAALHQGGVRLYLSDLPAFRQRKGELLVKPYLELFRWHRDLTDGISLNAVPHDVASRSDVCYNSPLTRRIQPWPAGNELVLTDPLWDFRDGFAPVQALLQIANRHPLAGATTEAELMVINDSLSATTVDVRARLRGPHGATVELAAPGGLKLAPGEAVRQPFRIAVPAAWPSGTCAVELATMQAGTRLAGNHYRLTTLAAADRRHAFPNRALALYEGAAARAPAGTGAILDQLGLACQRITTFDGLDRFQVLIVAAQAVDATWLAAGDSLRRWLEAGGRLLAFEQSATGALPFAQDERVMRLGCSSFMEIWSKNHPIFAGITDEMAWESPSGDHGAIFRTCLELTDGFLAISQASHNNDAGSTKAVISNRRLGRGEYLLSQVGTSGRFGSDAVITRYVENCLAYILGDAIAPEAVLAPAATATSTWRTFALDDADARVIDLRPAMNRGLADEVAGDGKGGWSDYGADSDMHALASGRRRFNGLLPFWIVPPAENQGNACIVLRGPTREALPAASAPIRIDDTLERIYFLHTLMYVTAAPGEVVLAYDLTYADGSRTTCELRNGLELADWWQGQDLANANVVHRDSDRCLYASEWVNPSPRLRLATLTVRSCGNAIPIVLAATGRRTFTQTTNQAE